MRPSVYDETLAKDSVVEDRDEVKVTFKGGNVFWIEAKGADAHEVRRGPAAAWERAEKLRLELNPSYVGTPAAKSGETTLAKPGEQPGASDEGAQAPAKPATNGGAKPPAAEPAVDKVYRVGDVVGVIRMVPVDLVMDFLGGDAGRVALLQGTSEARRLSKRVRATDGRCAPIFLTKHDVDDAGEEPALFDGLYTLACALNLGLERVAVVILPSGKVGAVQGSIAGLMRAALSLEGDDGEELMYKASA